MVKALLDYSRVNTRSSEFKPSNFEEILDQTLSSLKIAIDESKAIITIDTLPTLMVDDKQMVQLFQNLISNAIKFHNKNEGMKIYISYELNVQSFISKILSLFKLRVAFILKNPFIEWQKKDSRKSFKSFEKIPQNNFCKI